MTHTLASKQELLKMLDDSDVDDLDFSILMQGMPVLVALGETYDHVIKMERGSDVYDPHFWIREVTTMNKNEMMSKFSESCERMTSHGMAVAAKENNQWYEVRKFNDDYYTVEEINEEDV